MDSTIRRFTRSPTTAGNVHPVPSFGYDYRQNTKSIRSRDHSAMAEFHNTKDNPPAAPLSQNPVTTIPSRRTNAVGQSLTGGHHSPKLQPPDRNQGSAIILGGRREKKSYCRGQSEEVHKIASQKSGSPNIQQQESSIHRRDVFPNSPELQQTTGLEKALMNCTLPSEYSQGSPNQVVCTVQLKNQHQQQQFVGTAGQQMQTLPPSQPSQPGVQQLNQPVLNNQQGMWVPESNRCAATGQSCQLVGSSTYVNAANQQYSGNPFYIYPLPQPLTFHQLSADQFLSHQQTPVIGAQPGFFPGPTTFQPQVAIVATDPATLRALLTGNLTGQPFLPPMAVPQPNYPFNSPYQVHHPIVASSESSSTALFAPQPFIYNTLPVPPLCIVGSANSAVDAGRKSDAPTTSQSPMDISKHSLINFTQQQDVNPIPTIQPNWLVLPTDGQSLERTPDFSNKQPQKHRSEPEVLIQSRHTTRHQPSPEVASDRKPAASVQQIGHPPRTLRYRAQPELSESDLFVDEGRPSLHTVPNYREPKKLDPKSFLHQQAPDTEVRRRKSTDDSTIASKDATTSEVPCDPNSISAYYERLKKRASRPLSAYRPVSTLFDSDYAKNGTLPNYSVSSAVKNLQHHGSPQYDDSNERKCHTNQLKRAVTFGNEQIHSQCNLIENDDIAKRAEKDPSIVTVAERTRRWIEGRQREINDRHRYSTCGFVDEDLIDCPDIASVEDRVKMFDSRKTEEQIPVKLRSRKQLTTSISETVHAKSGQTGLRSTLPNKTIAAVRLRPDEETAKEPTFSRPRQVGLIQPIQQPSNKQSSVSNNVKTTGPNEPERDELSSMSVVEKRRLFSQENQTKAPVRRPAVRRKTQPVTLDDLARANQLILARLDGQCLNSPLNTVKGDDNESSGFQDRASELSTPEASTLSF